MLYSTQPYRRLKVFDVYKCREKKQEVDKKRDWGGRKGRSGKKGRRWQRHTLPPRYQGSTICAHELNCRVRNGTGCTLTALATNNLHLFTDFHPPHSHQSRFSQDWL